MDTIPVASHILNGDLTNACVDSNIISIAAKLINTTSVMKFLLIACDIIAVFYI
jgi:hypothetical protein